MLTYNFKNQLLTKKNNKALCMLAKNHLDYGQDFGDDILRQMSQNEMFLEVVCRSCHLLSEEDTVFHCKNILYSSIM